MLFALQENKLVSIDQVESGLRCGCICPACGEPLIARKGTKKRHHFAHRAESTCSNGYETSLHLAAKEILSQAKEIILPSVYVTFRSGKNAELLSPAFSVPIDRVELEKRFDSIIPDIVIHTGQKKILVEIYVTHPVDEQKLSKLRELGISCMEIDLHDVTFTTMAELANLLLGDNLNKKWVYNTAADRYHKLFCSAAQQFKITPRGFAFHVDHCPIAARTWHGKAYANVIDDCFYCPYNCELIYKDFDEEDGESLCAVLCLGKARISTIKELKEYLQKKQAACP